MATEITTEPVAVVVDESVADVPVEEVTTTTTSALPEALQLAATDTETAKLLEQADAATQIAQTRANVARLTKEIADKEKQLRDTSRQLTEVRTHLDDIKNSINLNIRRLTLPANARGPQRKLLNERIQKRLEELQAYKSKERELQALMKATAESEAKLIQMKQKDDEDIRQVNRLKLDEINAQQAYQQQRAALLQALQSPQQQALSRFQQQRALQLLALQQQQQQTPKVVALTTTTVRPPVTLSQQQLIQQRINQIRTAQQLGLL